MISSSKTAGHRDVAAAGKAAAAEIAVAIGAIADVVSGASGIRSIRWFPAGALPNYCCS